MTSLTIFEIVHHQTNGMYYPGSSTYSFVPHDDPARTDRRVVVHALQPLLDQNAIGHFFVRGFAHQSNATRVLDHSYIPSHPTEESCQEERMRLLAIAEDGTLHFEREKKKNPFWGTKEVQEITLGPEWNDSYWMAPEKYLQFCKLTTSHCAFSERSI